MSAPRAFVTGATGFVGSEVAMQLCQAGWQLTATKRPTSDTAALRGLEIQWVEADLHDPSSVTAVMPEGLDCVFHVAGNITFWKREFADQVRDNVDATRGLVSASLARQARRFVFTSSGAAYGRHDPPLRESLESRALESPIHYDRTKYLAECEVRAGIEQGLDAVILNPAAILGPRDPNFTTLFEQLAAGRLPAAMPADTSFCHIREVARAHLLAYEKGRCGENYLLGGPNAPQLELLQTFARVIGRKEPTKIMPPALLAVAGTVMEMVSAVTGKPPLLTRKFASTISHCWFVDSSKAITELGYAPPSLEELCVDIAEWMRSEGLLA